MKSDIKLQAHRGVSSEFPENSMSSFRAAVLQGYDYIELDPSYTFDGRIVVLHDSTLNRTARKYDASSLKKEIRIHDITYEDALEYDIGIARSIKFKGERIPLLREVLLLAREKGIKVKLDSKIEAFPEAQSSSLYELICEFEENVALTSGKAEMISFYAAHFPSAELHYDGRVNEEILEKLSVHGDRLTVWLPYRSKHTEWVKIPFADKALCSMVKRYARLGIWILNDTESYREVVSSFAPDIVETNGRIKPSCAAEILCDAHIHSESSHDSSSKICDIADAAIEKGLYAIAITDHCDIQYYYHKDIRAAIASSVASAREAAKKYDGRLKILKALSWARVSGMRTARQR